MRDNYLNEIIEICNEVQRSNPRAFSGFALAFYNNAFDLSTITTMRKAFKKPVFSVLDKEKMIDFLIVHSELDGIVHDGFHFIDPDGHFYGSGIYFVPPVRADLEINEKSGVRYHSALFGSAMKGIDMIAIMSSTKSIYVFKDGKLIYMKKYNDNPKINEVENA